jgi:hypothetical protein
MRPLNYYLHPGMFDWWFEDEWGITIDLPRGVTVHSTLPTTGARMGKFRLNDGRDGVDRTQNTRSLDTTPITMVCPYDTMLEFENRVGARFKVRDCWGRFKWLALETMECEYIYGESSFPSQQECRITMTFSQCNAI